MTVEPSYLVPSSRNVDLKTLKHEAEFFGVLPLGMCWQCMDEDTV